MHVNRLSLLLMSVTVFALPTNAQSICARVGIEIEQQAVISRNAFRAVLTINNNSPSEAMIGVDVDLDLRDPNGVAANDRFDIRPPTLTGIDDVNGNGSIPPESSATAEWIIVPYDDAAPVRPLLYSFGGQFTYTLEGGTLTIPMTPDRLTVLPNPRLEVKYFLEKFVFSNDPFTPEIEPTVPFSLGLIMRNIGAGDASNVRITSAQPRIVDNDRGLLINFEIIGTQVGSSIVSPSLAVNLGNIGPGQSAFARWLMTSTLAGQFVYYDARYEHIDGLGNPRLSLIDSIRLFETIHVVRIDRPTDDNLPDFLVDEPFTDPTDLPDEVHSSDGQVLPVTSLTNATVDGPPSTSDPVIVLTASMPAGWGYVRIDDPGARQLSLARVIRSDGLELRVPENAWTTSRTVHEPGQPPRNEDYLHIFDFNGTSTYTIVYGAGAIIPGGPVVDAIAVTSFRIAGLGTANPSNVEHAVREEATGRYVGADGTLSNVEFWQPASAWVGRTVVDLTADTEYRIRSKARSSTGVETAFGPTTTVRTRVRLNGDLNGDCTISIQDLAIILANFGTPAGAIPTTGDVDGDGAVTLTDLALLLTNFGLSCP